MLVHSMKTVRICYAIQNNFASGCKLLLLFLNCSASAPKLCCMLDSPPNCDLLLYSDAGQSVRHHMLTNYMHAILLVVLAQFTGLGFLDGMEGVVKLAEASPYVQVH